MPDGTQMAGKAHVNFLGVFGNKKKKKKKKA